MILCVGDYIEDFYVFGTAVRLCPEAPVPVIVPAIERTSAGGVGLVANQLRELGAEVVEWRGSFSRKERAFCGQHLVSRIDRDSLPFEPEPFPDTALRNCDAVVVSDYSKGGMFEEIATEIIGSGKPTFLDAKHHWAMYRRWRAENQFFFPNEQEGEHLNFPKEVEPRIIRKLGEHGCSMGNLSIPATVSEVVDVTGAGDIFIASFTWAMIEQKLTTECCLRFANAMAGESCRHRGTYVVGREFAQSVLDTVQVSGELQPQVPDYFPDSSPVDMKAKYELDRMSAQLSAIDASTCSLHGDLCTGLVVGGVCVDSLRNMQNLQRLTSSPIELTDVQIQEGTGMCSSEKSQLECTNQSPNASEHHSEHKREQDQDPTR